MNDKFDTFITNKGTDITLDIPTDIQTKLSESLDEIIGQTNLMIKNGSRSKKQGITIIESIYELMDLYTPYAAKDAVCGSGCAHCCSLSVELTVLEAENLRRHINNDVDADIREFALNNIQSMHKNDSFNWLSIEEYCAEFKDINRFTLKIIESDINGDVMGSDNLKDKLLHRVNQGNDKIGDMLKNRYPCMFLKDNVCTIYKYRPFACRKLFVVTDPEFCKGEDNLFINNTLFTLVNDIIATLSSMTYPETQHYILPEDSALLRRKNNGDYFTRLLYKSAMAPMTTWFKDGFSGLQLEG